VSHTEARLRAVAAQLGSGSLEDVNRVWGLLRGWDDVKKLYHSHPAQLRAIVSFARMKAKGDLAGGEAGYAEMVGKVVEVAVRRER